jgi:hypothetical protein
LEGRGHGKQNEVPARNDRPASPSTKVFGAPFFKKAQLKPARWCCQEQFENTKRPPSIEGDLYIYKVSVYD